MSRRVLITAGPTREPIDAVRYLSNRSSGALGVALANAAAQAGHDVTLLLGPVDSAVAERVDGTVTVERFETTAELQALLRDHFPHCALLIMAAAVADYRLAESETQDGKRERRGDWTLRFEATPDLVAGCASNKRDGQRVVAFALEHPVQLEARATQKMQRKGVDAIVANPLETMDAEAIDAVLLTADGQREVPGAMSKLAFAAWIIERLAELF
ncbi:MAG: phosphopantothenoylcysteine decarboxylase [Planctomycetota bacterium]